MLYSMLAGVQSSRDEGVGGITPGDADGQCADNKVVFSFHHWDGCLTWGRTYCCLVEEPLTSKALTL